MTAHTNGLIALTLLYMKLLDSLAASHLWEKMRENPGLFDAFYRAGGVSLEVTKSGQLVAAPMDWRVAIALALGSNSHPGSHPDA